MLLFDYVVILMLGILLSNIINKFIPSISVPIIQIALGIIISFIPLGYELTLNPELFLILFVAPLLFYDGILANKEALWKYKKYIFELAFGLVFISVIAIGFFVNMLAPTIPLAVCFALAAALAPTDAVAVSSIGKRIKMPKKIMQILKGESLINDASRFSFISICNNRNAHWFIFFN